MWCTDDWQFRRLPRRRIVFHRFFAVGFAAVCIALVSAHGQQAAGPQPVPLPATVPGPMDQPYPGTISLAVDLTNVNNRVLDVREAIPVRPGKLILLYPQWLPGTYSPSNAIDNL